MFKVFEGVYFGAVELVTGKALFSDDMPLDDAVILGVFRSKKSHARVVSVKE